MQNATKRVWGINLACWHVQRSQGFNRDWNEEVLTANVGILFLLAGSGKLCCSTCLAGGPSDVGFIQGAGDSYVPAQWPAALPWDECQTIRSLPVCAEQPGWLFCHRSSGWGKTSSDQVIESMVPSRPARCFSADKTVKPTSVDWWTAMALMWNAEI